MSSSHFPRHYLCLHIDTSSFRHCYFHFSSVTTPSGALCEWILEGITVFWEMCLLLSFWECAEKSQPYVCACSWSQDGFSLAWARVLTSALCTLLHNFLYPEVSSNCDFTDVCFLPEAKSVCQGQNQLLNPTFSQTILLCSTCVKSASHATSQSVSICLKKTFIFLGRLKTSAGSPRYLWN